MLDTHTIRGNVINVNHGQNMTPAVTLMHTSHVFSVWLCDVSEPFRIEFFSI